MVGGIEVEGSLQPAAALENHGVGECIVLSRARVSRGAQLLFAEPDAQVLLVGPRTLGSVRAGAADPSYWPAAEYSRHSTPPREPESPEHARLRALYELAAQADKHEASPSQHSVAAVHAALQREHPDEWLLRWNLLESLRRLDLDPARQASLVRELWRLEDALHGRYPIAMGLRYLSCPAPVDAS
jgi:hypothetical protein